MKRALLVSGLAMALILPSLGASAGFGIKIKKPKIKVDVPNASKKLNEVEQEYRKGLDAMPNKYGEKPAEEHAAVTSAEGFLKAGDDQYGKMLKMASGHERVDEKRAELETAIANGWLMHAAGKAKWEIHQVHITGKAAPDEKLAALDTAVAAFAGGASDGYKRQVEWWQKEAQRLREDNPRIAREAQEKAEREARRERAKLVAEATGELQKVAEEINAVVKEGKVAIAADMLTRYDEAVTAAAAVVPDALAYYTSQRKAYAGYNAWYDEGNEAKTIAALLGGDLVASGTSSGKKLAIPFKTKAGFCYLVTTSWSTYTGGERMEDRQFVSKSGYSALQYFWPNRLDSAGNHAAGVCTTKATALTWSTNLTFAGTKNGLKYAVVAWEKAKIDPWVVMYAGVGIEDSCDSVAFESLWLDPVPGTLLWREEEPFLMQRVDEANGSWVSARTVTNTGDKRLKKDGLKAQAPDARAFKTQFRTPSCPRTDPVDADSKRLASCHAKLDKKYSAAFEKAEKQKKYAKSLSSYRAAQKKLDKLPDQQRSERSKKCGPIEKKITARWEKTYNKLVDSFVDAPPKVTIDTPKLWMEESAPFMR